MSLLSVLRQPHRQLNAISLILVFAVSALAQSATPVHLPQQAGAAQSGCPSRTGTLEQGQTAICSLAADEIHHYQFSLKRGEYAHLEVEQHGVDVYLILKGPGDFERHQNWPSAQAGLEYLSFIAPADGTFDLEVTTSAGDKPAASNQYVLKYLERKAPDQRDEARAQAEELFAEGQKAANPAERSRLFSQAIDKWRSSGDRYGLATGLSSWGFLRGNTIEIFDHPDDLITLYREALAIWKSYEETSRQIQLNLYIAHVYDANARLSDAEKYYREAYDLMQRALVPLDAALKVGVLNNLGTLQHRLGADEAAITSFKLAIETAKGAHLRREQALVLNNLGNLYLEITRYNEAREYFSSAQTVRENKDYDPQGWATTRQNQGLLAAETGDLAKAEVYVLESLAIRKEKAPERVYETLHGLAYVKNLQGKDEDALKIFADVLSLAEKHPAEKAITLLNIGGIHYSKGRKDQALEIYKQASALIPSIDNPAVEWQVLFALGRSERERDDPAALDHLARAYSIVEGQRTKRVIPAWRAQYLAETRAVYEAYVDSLMLTADRRNDPQLRVKALEIAERARARSLLELLVEAHTDINGHADPTLLSQYRDVQADLGGAEYQRQQREFDRAPQRLQEAAKARVASLRARLEELEGQIRLSNKALTDVLAPQPISAEDMFQSLDPGRLVLEFMLGDQGSHMWVISRSGLIASAPLPPRAVIEKKANNLSTILSDGRGNFADAARDLGGILLSPAAKYLGDNELIIVPDGALYYVPFAALPNPGQTLGRSRSEDYLISRHAIVTLPSLSTLIAQRNLLGGRNAAPGALAVFADPVYDRNDEPHKCETGAGEIRRSPEARNRVPRPVRGADEGELKYPRLEYTQAEMRALLSLPSSGGRLRACGYDANFDVAMSPQLSQYRLLHFATHGSINTEYPELSGLVLSLVDKQGRSTPEGVLRMNDIYNMKLNADVVVLSACETARGKLIKGEGMVGLTRAFLAAGAARVVASLWKVGDHEVTVSLMKDFYTGILGKRKLPPAIALQEAQKQVLKDHPGLNPRYWAAFILEGEYR
jgi:CHAT domain-containing protein/Tfp pilus assembly protein PilF